MDGSYGATTGGVLAAGQITAARLDASYPCWHIWYGAYSRKFWAVPIDWPSDEPLILQAADSHGLIDQIRTADVRVRPSHLPAPRRPSMAAPIPAGDELGVRA